MADQKMIMIHHVKPFRHCGIAANARQAIEIIEIALPHKLPAFAGIALFPTSGCGALPTIAGECRIGFRHCYVCDFNRLGSNAGKAAMPEGFTRTTVFFTWMGV
jgi:hypothetical protein